MNLFNIVEELEKIDPELNDRLNPRRAAIKNITSFGSKVALAAVPFALGTMLKKAYGAEASTSVVDVLNYALTLEYLESSFYNQGAASAGLIPASASAYINTVKDDENQHVAFLKTAITASGGTPVASPKFDFTAGGGTGNGPFKGLFSNYSLFLKVALAFEDTGVRAYKGQAPNLLGNKDILTAALSIHAVEARHASAIRQLLGVSPWITSTATVGNDTGVPQVNGNYAGEETIVQGGVDLTTLPSATGSTTSVAVATAAFDEPLSKDQVLALLVGTFIYS
ncbi:ferritin-like domain-containing protein [Mucilaginibacter celer]|uniref:Ferritin-like domain-containing protein n=1 Tax=Mucilaginibacter celer TaxID=2305508 RepID=A0A494VWN7_9SPHI|nr:ferritin-like domain-containing protein [Mucilaginibacter celer]AYL97890.1 ferritin-like domain-containing protein [Mucilaginibacter celer]